MRFSRWDAQGNVYLLTEQAELTADAVRAAVADTDGILQVTARGEDWVEIVIWNPDGSTAELSGNGTRIVARWLAGETGAAVVRVRVGPREVVARMLAGDDVEQDMGEVVVHERERVAGLDVTAVSVGNLHAVVEGDPDDLPLIGPLLETHPRYPNRTNVQVARRDGPGAITARVWERGAGETASSGTSAAVQSTRASPSGPRTQARRCSGSSTASHDSSIDPLAPRGSCRARRSSRSCPRTTASPSAARRSPASSSAGSWIRKAGGCSPCPQTSSGRR